MAIVPVKRASVSEQVYEQLKNNLINGAWKVGEKIPSENELASMLGTSRMTVRQALSRLNTLGLIETRLGEGSFVCELKPGFYLKEMIPYTYLGWESIREILDFRVVIEVGTASLAVDRITDEQIEQLEETYRKMKENIDNVEIYSREDIKFHCLIAEFTGNSLIIQLQEIIKDITTSFIYQVTSEMGADNGIKYHREIIDAFKDKDKDRVEQMVRQHLMELENYIKESDTERISK